MRDPVSAHASSTRRDGGATSVCMHRPLSTASTHAALDLSTRLRRLSTCGITHIFHLTTGFEVGGIPRVMSPAEIARMGVTPLGHPLPAWQCEEVQSFHMIP